MTSPIAPIAPLSPAAGLGALAGTTSTTGTAGTGGNGFANILSGVGGSSLPANIGTPAAGATAVSGAAPTGTVTAPTAIGGIPATGSVGAGLARQIGKGLDALMGSQQNASQLAISAATGGNVDPAQLTIATTEATLMTQVAQAIQTKAVTAFNTIMGLQA